METQPYRNGDRITLYEYGNEKSGNSIRFTIKRESGRGASCIAYEAESENGLPTHLKKLAPKNTPAGTEEYEAAAKNFLEACEQQKRLLADNETLNITAGLFGVYRDEEGCIWSAVRNIAGNVLAKAAWESSLKRNTCYIRKTAECIKAYHQAGWLLLDLKPENVLVIDSLGLYGINFFDFDSFIAIDALNKAIDEGKELKISSTPEYSAPELRLTPVNLRSIGKACDTYAAGALMHYAVFGTTPEIICCIPGYTYDYSGARPEIQDELTAEVKAQLSRFFSRTLTMLPEGRYADDDEVIGALETLEKELSRTPAKLIKYLPAYTENYIGREAETAELAARLRKGDKRIFICGAGGVGKSELAKKTAAELKEEFDFCFVSWQGSVRGTLLMLKTDDANDEGKSEEERARAIAECLKRNAGRTVIIVDNYEADHYDTDMGEFAAWQAVFLFTTRDEVPERSTLKLASLETKDLLRMMKSSLKDAEEEQLGEIIRLTDGHTMTADIIARTVAVKAGRTSLAAMAKALKKTEQTGNDTRHVKKLLGAVLKSTGFTKEEMNALTCACLLPIEGINTAMLLAIIPEERLNIWNRMKECGWLQCDGSERTWTMHPMLKEVCLCEQSTAPDKARVKTFIDGLRTLDRNEGRKKYQTAYRMQINSMLADYVRLPEGQKKKSVLPAALACMILLAAGMIFYRGYLQGRTEPPAPESSGNPAAQEAGNDTTETEAEPLTQLAQGDTYIMGAYEQDGADTNGAEPIEWTVLKAEDGKALLVSRYALDAVPFHAHDGKTTWETSSIREWLNGEFLNAAFTEEERGRIAGSRLENKGNEHYGNYGETADTTDRIFLLSLAEVEESMTENESRKCVPTEYAIKRGAWLFRDTGCCDWWTRTAGGFSGGVAYVKNSGTIEYEGNGATHTDNAVRPAMVITLPEK